MSIKVGDRIRQNTLSTGVGGVSLVGDVPGFKRFSDVLSSGDITYYVIEENDKFEVGVGIYGSDNLERFHVLSSSNNGNKIELGGSGAVFVTYPADKSVIRDLESQVIVGASGLVFENGTTFKEAKIVELTDVNLAGTPSNQYLIDFNTTNKSLVIGESAGPSNSRNTLIGHGAGSGITSGISNTNIGTDAGHKNEQGFKNVSIGDLSGPSDENASISVSRTVNVGYQAGEKSRDDSVNIGFQAGAAAYSRGHVSIGSFSGSGVGNYAFIGGYEAATDHDGDYLVAIGYRAAKDGGGESSVWIGKQAGQDTSSAINSIGLGELSGQGSSGNNSIYLGKKSGKDNADNDMLFVSNNDPSAEGTLIKGNFSTKRLAVGKSDVTLSDTFYVGVNSSTDNGIVVQGASLQSSDLTQWRAFDGLSLASVSNSGTILSNGIAASGQGVRLDSSTPVITDSTLYNVAGSLYWSGSSLTDQISYASGQAIVNEADIAYVSGIIENNTSGDTYVSGIAVYSSGQAIANQVDISYVSGVAVYASGNVYDDSYISGVAVYSSGQAIQNEIDIAYISGVVENNDSGDTYVSGIAVYSSGQAIANQGDISYVSGIAIYASGNVYDDTYISGVATYSSGILVDGGTLIPDADKGITIAKGSENFPITITQDENSSGGVHYVRLTDNDTDNITFGGTDADAFQITASGEGSSGAENILKFSSLANDDHLVFGGSTVPTKVLGSNITVNAEGSVELQRGGSTRVRGDSAFTYLFGQTGGYIFYGANALKPQSATSIALGGASNYWGSLYSSNANLKGSAAINVPLTIDAQAAQSANLTEWKASDGVVIAQVEPDGSIASSGDISASGDFAATNFNSSVTNATASFVANSPASQYPRAVFKVGAPNHSITNVALEVSPDVGSSTQKTTHLVAHTNPASSAARKSMFTSVTPYSAEFVCGYGHGNDSDIPMRFRPNGLSNTHTFQLYDQRADFYVDTYVDGNLNVEGAISGARGFLESATTTDSALTITSAVSQTANLQEWRASDDVVIAQVSPDGSIATSGDVSVSGVVTAQTLSAVVKQYATPSKVTFSDGGWFGYLHGLNGSVAFRWDHTGNTVYGRIQPGSNNSVSNGTSAYRWSDFYSVDGDFSNTVSTSGIQASGALLHSHTPTDTSNKLYNNGGTLMFNGSAVDSGQVSGAASGVAFFGNDGLLTDDTSFVFNSGNKELELSAINAHKTQSCDLDNTGNLFQVDFTSDNTWLNNQYANSFTSKILGDGASNHISNIRSALEFRDSAHTGTSYWGTNSKVIFYAPVSMASHNRVIGLEGGFSNSHFCSFLGTHLIGVRSYNTFSYNPTVNSSTKFVGFKSETYGTSVSGVAEYRHFWATDTTFTEIGNSYGLYVEEQTKGVTGNYSIYTDGGLSEFNGRVSVVGDSSTQIPFAIKSAVSQSANLTEWQASDGVVVAQVAPDGSIASSGDVSASGDLVTNGQIRLGGGTGPYIKSSSFHGYLMGDDNSGAIRWNRNDIMTFKSIGPNTGNAYNIGSSLLPYRNLYLGTSLHSSGVITSGVLLHSHVPTDTTSQLYNDGGTLKFNGSAVGGSVTGTPSGVAFFGDDGSITDSLGLSIRQSGDYGNHVQIGINTGPSYFPANSPDRLLAAHSNLQYRTAAMELKHTGYGNTLLYLIAASGGRSAGIKMSSGANHWYVGPQSSSISMGADTTLLASKDLDATRTVAFDGGWGRMAIGGVYPGASLHVKTNHASLFPVGLFQGTASQVANLTEWRASDDVVVAQVAPDGSIASSGDISASGTISAVDGDFSGTLNVGNFGFNDSGTNFYLEYNGSDTIKYKVGDAFSLEGSAYYAIGATSNTPDVKLRRDDANILALRNGTNSQTFRIYGSGDSTNGEWLEISNNGTEFQINSLAAGDGTVQAVGIGRSNSMSMIHNGSGGTKSRSIYPQVNNTYSCGIPNLRWAILNSINGSFTGSVSGARGFFESATTTDSALTITSATSQTANLTEWKNSSDETLTRVTSDGSVHVSGDIVSEQGGEIRNYILGKPGDTDTEYLKIGSIAGALHDIKPYKTGSGQNRHIRICSADDRGRLNLYSDGHLNYSFYSNLTFSAFHWGISVSGEIRNLQSSNPSSLGQSTSPFAAGYLNSVYTSGVQTSGVLLNSHVPTVTTNTLYNDGGTLMFNGSAVGGGGGVTGTPSGVAFFADDGSLTDNTDFIVASGNDGRFVGVNSDGAPDRTLVVGNKKNLGNAGFKLVNYAKGNALLEIVATSGGRTAGVKFSNGTNDWWSGPLQNSLAGLGSRHVIASYELDNTKSMVYDTNGNVVIGGTSPSARLHVNALNSSSVNSIFQAASAQSANITEWRASDSVVIAKVTADGSIASSGNIGASGSIGIGMFTAGDRLTVAGNLSTKHINQVTNALRVTHNSNDVYLSLYKRANQSTPEIKFGTAGDSYFNAGNLGIGTTSPNAMLDVNGMLNASGVGMMRIAEDDYPSYQEGTFFYDDENHALAIYNDESETIQRLGQEGFLRVRNNTAETINAGSAVLITGVHGASVPTVSGAIATSEVYSQVVGLSNHSIEANSFGYITTYGKIVGVDTSQYSEGDEIFLSSENIGSGVSTSPVVPNYKISIGHCINSHANNGSVMVQLGHPKLGGGDTKSVAPVHVSGIPFVSGVANEGSSAVLMYEDGFEYSQGSGLITKAVTANSGITIVNDATSSNKVLLRLESSTGAEVLTFKNSNSNTTPVPMVTYPGGYFSTYNGFQIRRNASTGMALNVTNSSAHTKWRVNAEGSMVFGGSSSLYSVNPRGMLDIYCNSSTSKGVIVQGAAAQSENLTQWQASDEVVVASVSADGSIATSGNISASGTVTGDTFKGTYTGSEPPKVVFSGTSGYLYGFNSNLSAKFTHAAFTLYQDLSSAITNTIAIGSDALRFSDVYSVDGSFTGNLNASGVQASGMLLHDHVPADTSSKVYNNGGTLTWDGHFAASSKSFLIDHPTKKDAKLQYASLEGPENGVYVRGRVTENVIELPDHWTGLIDEESITVQLTAKGHPQPNMFVSSIVNNKVYISSDVDIDAFYNVYAERKDIDKLEVEIWQ